MFQLFKKYLFALSLCTFLVCNFFNGSSLNSANAQVTFPENTSATSPDSQPHVPSFGETMFKMLPMFAMVFVIFYLMVLKPQQQKLQSQKEMIDSLKKGDSVVTSGGILGRVAGIEQDHILLEIATNVRIKVEIAHITKQAEKAKTEKATATTVVNS